MTIIERRSDGEKGVRTQIHLLKGRTVGVSIWDWRSGGACAGVVVGEGERVLGGAQPGGPGLGVSREMSARAEVV